MALKLLLGNSSPATPGTTGYVSPRVTGTLFTALLTGKAAQFRLFSSATSGNFYGAIYDEEQNGNLLWEASSETAIDSGDWAEQDIDSHLDITKDDDYNIAAMADSTNIIRYESVTGAFSWLQVGGLNAYGDGFPDPGTYSSQIKYTGRNWHIQVWGYVPPTVTSVNGGSSIEDGDTSVAIVGTDFVDTDASSTDPKAYLSPTSTFSASTAVEQTITGTITDTGFNITVDATGLSTGTVYFFVETGLEQMSDGEAVTLTGGASIPTGEDVDLDNSEQTFTGSGFTIPTSGAVPLSNSSQTVDADGYTIPVSESATQENSAQSFYGTGSVIIPLPVGQPVNLTNSLQAISASGFTIPVGQAVNLDNDSQATSATGYTIPVSDSQSLENSEQSFVGTGFIPAQVPTGQPVNLENTAQSIDGDGYTIPVSETINLENDSQTIYGTGFIPPNIPTGQPVNLTNSTQGAESTGYTIAVSSSESLINSDQLYSSSGFTIPIGQATALINAAQTLYGTGRIPIEPTRTVEIIPLTRDDTVFALTRNDNIIGVTGR